MRKLTAILMLAILLFNWSGYRLYTGYLLVQGDNILEAKFNTANFSSEDLIEIKVPLNLPYISNWDDFERYDGEIELNGVHYKYVKRKIYNDSLILLCLPNKYKMEVKDAEDDFFKQVHGLQAAASKGNEGKPEKSTIQQILSEYWVGQSDWRFRPIIKKAFNHPIYNSRVISLYYKTVTEQPPDC